MDWAQAGASAFGTIANIFQNNKNRAWSEKMWEKQAAYQTSERVAEQQFQSLMWNRSNEYNDATSQMERMQAAGINPNNAAAAVAGVQSSASSFGNPTAPSAPAVTTPQNYNIGSSIDDLLTKVSQIEFQNSAKEVNEANAENIKADTENKEAENANIKLTGDKLKKEIKKLDGEIDMQPDLKNEVLSRIFNNLANASLSMAEVQEVEQKAKNLAEELNLIKANIDTQRETIKNLKEQREVMHSTMELNEANAALAKAEEELHKSEKAYQDKINNFEDDLQQYAGTSTKASQNPIINNEDRAAILAGKGIEKGNQSSGSFTPAWHSHFGSPVNSTFNRPPRYTGAHAY